MSVSFCCSPAHEHSKVLIHSYRSTKDFAGNVRAREKTGSARRVNEPLPRAESNRTLLDIIREEGGGQKDSKKSWRNFKDKLRRRNSGRGSAWTSTVPVPTSDIPINNNRMISRHPSTRINPSLESDPTTEPDISAVPDARTPSLLRNPSRAMERASGRFDHTREQRPVRMSLMSLLAETDKQMGFDGLAYMMEEEDDEDEEEDGGGAGGAEYNICCVCMVRHKGAAFVPCGHSFCRLCSRELWVERGNCPLCNNYILEILDIF
ncbi:hypothetical protein Pfo_018522 [Paulownia fortunei]|nr:hypothetical protein Pfo_018522 [Paulownia fortunei]